MSVRIAALLALALAIAFAGVPAAAAGRRCSPCSARIAALAMALLVELRLPARRCSRSIYGATLGASGAAIQALFANPLASPDLTGTTSGAALGAVVTAYLLGFTAPIALSIGAVAGALGALALLLALAGPRAETATLLLSGLAISALAGALTTLALALAPSPFAFYDAYDWLMGSLVDRSLAQTAFAAVPALLTIVLLLRLGPAARPARPRRGRRPVARPRRRRAAAAGRLPDRPRRRRLRRDLRRDRLHRPGRADLRPPADRAAIPAGRSCPAAAIGALLLTRRRSRRPRRAARADAADRRRHRLARRALLPLAGRPYALEAAVVTPLLEARGLSLPGRLHDVAIDLAAGELVCLVGPNGSGKTSLLHALAGIGGAVGRGQDRRHCAGRWSARPSGSAYSASCRQPGTCAGRCLPAT